MPKQDADLREVLRVTITLRPDVLARLDRMAGDMDMSRSGFITYLVQNRVVITDEEMERLSRGEYLDRGIWKKVKGKR